MNKSVDEYNNSYLYSIDKNPISAEYFALSEKVETNSKLPKFKVGDRVRITKCKNIFSKGYTENWSKGIFVTDSTLKDNPWMYKIKDLKGGKVLEVFMKKKCC